MKKILAGLLCLVMLCSTVTVSVSALTGNDAYPNLIYSDKYMLGDANEDKTVSALDSAAMKKFNAGIGEVDMTASDIIADGKINSKDLLAIKKHLGGREEDAVSQYDTDNAVAGFSIGGNDISEYCIVYPENAKYVENIYYAADTLRKYINFSTGINLTISTEPTAERVIEFVDVTAIDGLEEKLGIEDYEYAIEDGNVKIYGTRRGSLFTVYEIIEKYLGLRFYSDHYTYQYYSRGVDIPEGTHVYRDPALDFRIAKQSFQENHPLHHFPLRLNGSQTPGYREEFYGTVTGPFHSNAHSYGEYWQMATGMHDFVWDGTNYREYAVKLSKGYKQNESEWNPCFTSDEQYEVLFRGMMETMRYVAGWKVVYEETTSMSFSICDNRTVCSCTSCKYIYDDGFIINPATQQVIGERLGCGEAGLNLNLANRAARDIVKYYEGRPASTESYFEEDEGYYGELGYGEAIYDEWPGMKIYTIFYDHTLPHELLFTDERYKNLIPEENLIIMFCGNPCNNHFMGSGECGDQLNSVGENGYEDAMAFIAWGEAVKKAGAQIWFWYYPVNYNTKITDSPNLFNIYHDFVFVIEKCNVNGIYYEGSSYGYLQEDLKAHLAAVFMWSFEYDENGELHYMSYEEFCNAAKEYLMIFYGDGYEEIYRYLEMHDEAGNESGICYLNNCDYPGDMFDYEYSRDNYEEMRGLLESALAKADTDEQKFRINCLIASCDALGLSACYKSYYVNGTSEQKNIYTERYTWMFNFLRDNNLKIFSDDSVYDIQKMELDVSVAPFMLFYTGGTWRAELADEWGKLAGHPAFQ